MEKRCVQAYRCVMAITLTLTKENNSWFSNSRSNIYWYLYACDLYLKQESSPSDNTHRKFYNLLMNHFICKFSSQIHSFDVVETLNFKIPPPKTDKCSSINWASVCVEASHCLLELDFEMLSRFWDSDAIVRSMGSRELLDSFNVDSWADDGVIFSVSDTGFMSLSAELFSWGFNAEKLWKKYYQLIRKFKIGFHYSYWFEHPMEK